MLLSYDSVCGQKEIGTLRLISSLSLQSSVVDRQESGCSDSGIDGFRSSASGRVAHELAYQQIRDEAQADGLIVRDRSEAESEKQTQNRLSLGVILARILPAFALKNATIRLTGMGIARQQRFFQEFIRYRRGQYFKWAREREDQDSLRRSDPDTYGEFTWHIDGLPRFTYTERWPDPDLQYAMFGPVCACPMGTGVLLRRICSKIPTGRGTDRPIVIPFLRPNSRSCGMLNGTSGRDGIRIISSNRRFVCQSAQSASCAAGPADASVHNSSPGCGELYNHGSGQDMTDPTGAYRRRGEYLFSIPCPISSQKPSEQ